MTARQPPRSLPPAAAAAVPACASVVDPLSAPLFAGLAGYDMRRGDAERGDPDRLPGPAPTSGAMGLVSGVLQGSGTAGRPGS